MCARAPFATHLRSGVRRLPIRHGLAYNMSLASTLQTTNVNRRKNCVVMHGASPRDVATARAWLLESTNTTANSQRPRDPQVSGKVSPDTLCHSPAVGGPETAPSADGLAYNTTR